jgi:hypothetical protein
MGRTRRLNAYASLCGWWCSREAEVDSENLPHSLSDEPGAFPEFVQGLMASGTGYQSGT